MHVSEYLESKNMLERQLQRNMVEIDRLLSLICQNNFKLVRNSSDLDAVGRLTRRGVEYSLRLSLVVACRQLLLAEAAQLEVNRQAGLEFQRHDRGRFAAKLMPEVPVGTKAIFVSEVEKASTGIWTTLLGLAAVVATFGVVVLTALYAPWNVLTLTSEVLPLRGPVGVLCTLLGGALLYRGASKNAMIDSLFASRQDFMSGAEKWAWGGRFKSCLAYALHGWWILLGPLTVVPIRFGLASASLAYYLRVVRQRGHVEALVRTTLFMSVVARVLSVVGGSILVALAIAGGGTL